LRASCTFNSRKEDQRCHWTRKGLSPTKRRIWCRWAPLSCERSTARADVIEMVLEQIFSGTVYDRFVLRCMLVSSRNVTLWAKRKCYHCLTPWRSVMSLELRIYPRSSLICACLLDFARTLCSGLDNAIVSQDPQAKRRLCCQTSVMANPAGPWKKIGACQKRIQSITQAYAQQSATKNADSRPTTARRTQKWQGRIRPRSRLCEFIFLLSRAMR